MYPACNHQFPGPLAPSEVNSSSVRLGVVGDDLGKTTPSAEDVSKNEVHDRQTSILRSTASFGVGRGTTPRMVNISVGSGVGHEERIHVGLPEERRNEGDHRGDIEVLGLADLTVMTRSNKPAYIVGKVRPPEPDEKDTGRCEVAFVSELVVSVRDEAISVSLGADPHLPSGYIENKLRTIK